MATTQPRAKEGGEFGANGEWYEGGRFINTIKENAKKHGSRRGSGKQEIAPYEWVVAPEGKNSLYRLFAGVFGKVINGKAEYVGSEAILRYVGRSREEAQAILDRWNAGERWR